PEKGYTGRAFQVSGPCHFVLSSESDVQWKQHSSDAPCPRVLFPPHGPASASYQPSHKAFIVCAWRQTKKNGRQLSGCASWSSISNYKRGWNRLTSQDSIQMSSTLSAITLSSSMRRPARLSEPIACKPGSSPPRIAATTVRANSTLHLMSSCESKLLS